MFPAVDCAVESVARAARLRALPCGGEVVREGAPAGAAHVGRALPHRPAAGGCHQMFPERHQAFPECRHIFPKCHDMFPK
jgi:hypothetical protein